MANPWAGEVLLHIDGEPLVCKLTLGTLAELEDSLGEATIVDVVARFESGRFSARDVLSVLIAGLRGGGWKGTVSDLRTAEIDGGPVAAAKVAAQLLARAFSFPTSDD